MDLSSVSFPVQSCYTLNISIVLRLSRVVDLNSMTSVQLGLCRHHCVVLALDNRKSQ